MIRLLIAALLVLFVQGAFASGKITLQNNFQNGGKEYRPMVGFNVYEPVTSLAHLNLWTGYGKQYIDEFTEDVNWWVSKAQLDLHVFHKLTVAPGVQYRVVDRPILEDKKDTTVYVKLDYQLW